MGDDPDSIPEREMKVRHLPASVIIVILNNISITITTFSGR